MPLFAKNLLKLLIQMFVTRIFFGRHLEKWRLETSLNQQIICANFIIVILNYSWLNFILSISAQQLDMKETCIKNVREE